MTEKVTECTAVHTGQLSWSVGHSMSVTRSNASRGDRPSSVARLAYLGFLFEDLGRVRERVCVCVCE